MPLYQYQCPHCREPFEVTKPMSEAAHAESCDFCGLGPADRVYGVAQIKTSNTFLAGRPTGGDQFGDKTREHMLRLARQAGVSTDGKCYDGRLANFPGDPEAWIQSPDDARALLEKRGWGCEGDITVKAPDRARAKDKPLADDLVAERVEDVLEAQLGPDFTEAKGPIVERAVEDVMNKHAQPAHLLKE